MINGHFTYYAIQFRQTHESPWLKPEGKLKKIDIKDKWSHCGAFFYVGLNPWKTKYPHESDYAHKYQDSHDELDKVNKDVGEFGLYGWYTLKFAEEALKRLWIEDKNGTFDSFDGYSHHEQAIRHEFRIVKCTLTHFYNEEVLE